MIRRVRGLSRLISVNNKHKQVRPISLQPNMEPVTALRSLGYDFNSEGQLRKINKNGEISDEPFQFNVSNDHQECQAHYEVLGDAVTNYIYHLLETEVHLKRLPVPKDCTEGTFIFVSKDYEKKNTLIVLIHGSGAVRAGQWARSLVINENLDKGTQIPYIKRALSNDYGVMVLNTNDNCLSNGKKIKYSGSAEDHAYYVWDTYISKTQADNIVIVAHSYGGVVTVTLADKIKADFEKRVKAIAFTDSVHGFSNIKISDFIRKVSRNWISSASPLDLPEKTPDFDITRVSAGHERHEMTSYSCIDAVFKYIAEKLKSNS